MNNHTAHDSNGYSKLNKCIILQHTSIALKIVKTLYLIVLKYTIISFGCSGVPTTKMNG